MAIAQGSTGVIKSWTVVSEMQVNCLKWHQSRMEVADQGKQ